MYTIVTEIEIVSNSSYGKSKPGKAKLNKAIDSSFRFKYLRSLEALFESTPQAVIQLVYVMRTSSFNNQVFILSIVQSVLSMANSMLKQDNAYMKHSKWYTHKKRLPPTKQFIKHATFRLMEITSRIGLFALFWTVVGGQFLMVLICIELLFPIIYNTYVFHFKFSNNGNKENESTHVSQWTELFLSLHIIVSVPPEWIFEQSVIGDTDDWMLQFIFYVASIEGGRYSFCAGIILLPLIVFIFFWQYTISVPFCSTAYYPFSSMRMLMSLSEWIIVITYGISVEQYDNNYLLSSNKSLWFFILSMICFIIYSYFYPLLMPDIRLKDNIAIRSLYGFAYLGNIDELEKMFLYNCQLQCSNFHMPQQLEDV